MPAKTMSASRGFTLIEAILVIVILGIAMVTLSSFLFPQVERSVIPHYQTRAVALGQSIMNQVLAKGFDEHGDNDNGGLYRCGELDTNGNQTQCTQPALLGAEDNGKEIQAGQLVPSQFNDVDDFIGCWYSDETKNTCPASSKYTASLASLVGGSAADYRNFQVVISVVYDEAMDGNAESSIGSMKRISVHISASQFVDLTLVGYKGNY